MREEISAGSAQPVNDDVQVNGDASGVQMASVDLSQPVLNGTGGEAGSAAMASTGTTPHVTHIAPGPDGVVQLPPGVTLESITVEGRDLVIHLPDGSLIIIDNGAVYVPELVIGEVHIPAINLAALLIGNEPQPAAGGPSSSGGNFTVPVGDIGPGIGLGNLLPPTELRFGAPEFREIYPGVPDKFPSVVITTPQQPLGVQNAVTNVDEAGLPARDSEPAGSDAAADSETVGGSIIFDAGDPPATVTINDEPVTDVGQVIHGQYGDLTITSIADGNITYSYTLLDNTDGDNTADDFTVVVTDSDGDTATATLHVDIIDDVPTARADTDSVTEGGAAADGNVFTGSGGEDANTTDGVADVQGADGAHVTGVVAGSASSASGNLGDTVQGQYGSLVLDSTGHYVYTLDPNNPDVNALNTGQHLTDTFSYTITDGDGDTSTTTLTITINGTNDAPQISSDSTAVSEEGLPGGIQDDGGTSDTTNSATAQGDLTITDPDNSSFTVTLSAPSEILTSHGATIAWTGEGTGTLIGSANGEEVIRVAIDGTGHYTVTLSGPIDHPVANAEDAVSIVAPVTVNDGSGGTDSSSLTISIEDDSPSVSPTAGPDADVTTLTQDQDTIGTAHDTASADFSVVFDGTSAYGADGPGTTVRIYALSLTVADGAASGLSSDGHAIYLYNVGGEIVGSTSATGDGVNGDNTIFTLDVDANSGVVTQTQYAEIDHPLPGSSSNYDSQIVSLADGLVRLTATTTVTDYDNDTVSGSEHIDLGGNIQFADDGPSVVVVANSDAELSLTTQDHETIGSAFDTATGDVSGLFTVTPDYGADGPGTNSLSYSMTLLVAQGTSSGLSSDGATIYLYDIGGVITGSTSANGDGVSDANTIFTLQVDPSGVVTSTQYAEIDHSLPGDTSNYDSQLATLANGLVGVTASDTITDGDGDTATDSQTIDLGGNIHFADDGPSVTVRAGSDAEAATLTQDHDTLSGPDTATADFSAVFTSVVDFGADVPGTSSTTYTLSLVGAQGEDSGLTTDGHAIFLYNVDGDIVGSTSTTADGVGDANTVFTLTVDDSGVVTQTQYAEIDHPLPGDTANYDSQVTSLANGLVNLTATTTATDYDGDTATASQSVDLGGNVQFADDGPAITVTLGSDSAVTLTTQDHDTLGGPDTATADVSSVFTVTPDYGADVPGSTGTTYAMTLLAAQGSDSGLTSHGATIYLYDVGGTIVGSTSATAVGVGLGNTVFTLAVDGSGTVTQTQYAPIDHALPGDTSNYDAQLATLANGLVGVTATATATDYDGDTATASQTVDLGGNVNFADDGPSISPTVDPDDSVVMLTQDHETIGAAFDTATGDFSLLFDGASSYGADGPGSMDRTYALNLTVAQGTASGLTSGGNTVYLYQDGEVIVGSTSATAGGVSDANTVFTLEVDTSGTVTSTQYAEIDHPLPGDTSNYDSQVISLANGLVQLTATTTVTDFDGDTATGDEHVDLGGNIQFADDGPSVTVRASSDAELSVTTQDHETIGAAFDTASADVSGLFTVVSDYGADIPGTNSLSYSMTLLVAEGTSSGLSSGGQTVYLYQDIDGVVIGSTSATEGGVSGANTIFTLEVDSSGTVTSTQYAEIDHPLPGDTSNYDTQLATLANGLVGVTATDTVTDYDGDRATASQTIDLGGNIHYADDGPSITVTLGSDSGVDLTTQDHETIGAAFDTATADVSSVFTVSPNYGADVPGSTNTTYSMTLLVADGADSGLSSHGSTIYLYDVGGTIVGSTSATAIDVGSANTIFTLQVDGSGTVTQTQFAQIDHALPGDTSNYDAQLATLANGLVGVTATATATDYDGDTATASQTVDLGGNVHFADDGPWVSTSAGSDAEVVALTQDHETIGAAYDTATADFSAVFGSAASYGADGPGTTATIYTLSLTVADGTSSGLSSGGQTIYLYDVGDTIVGSTSATALDVGLANTVFTLEVDGSGVVTSTQYAEIDHPLPGDTSNYDSQVASLANGLVQLSATTTVTDYDGDTATGTSSVDLGGNIQFADDGPSVTVTLGSDTGVTLTTQDHETIGSAFDTATASVASVFTVTPDYGADVPGSTTTTYAMTLLVAEGASSGLSSGGQTIYLYQDINGVVVGSTSATEGGVSGANTVFTLEVNTSTGLVTQTQFAEIDHALPGDTSNYDAQLATLANGLVGVTATATSTDYDGDTATDSQTVDLGGNVRFADDGPSVNVTTTSDAAVVALTQDHETIGAAFDTATADFSTVFHAATAYGADIPGSVSTIYTLSLAVADGTSSGLSSDGATIYLYEAGGVITGSTSATEGGISGANTIFTLTVDGSGVVTSTQYAEIDHSLPGDTSNYDSQVASLANGLVNLTATTTATDYDGDTATDSATIDLGGNIQFADDGPSVTVTKGSDSGVLLTTQDHDTIGSAFDTATASVASVFTVAPDYGADGPGTTSTSYAMTLLVASGTSSGMSSDGHTIYLYDVGGVITGSTSADPNTVDATNTIFTLEVNSSTGLVTQTQFAEIDHSLPGDTSNYDAQLATLANGLVGVTATATTTDGDGDTATDQQTVDLGGNVSFADDGPSTSSNNTVLLDDDALSGGNPGGTGDDVDSQYATGTLGHDYGADGAGTVLLTGTSTLPTGFTSSVSNGGQTLTIYQGATAVLQVQLTNTTSGAYTVTQLAPIDHPITGTEDNLEFTVTYQTKDGDGDTANGSLTINVDDDSPVITSSGDITGMTGQTGSGTLAFSVGADHVATDDLTAYLSVSLSGSVGTGSISDVHVTADATASTSTLAVYDISFVYSPNPADPLTTVTETGTLTFDGSTYSIALDDPIQSYSISHTANIIAQWSYDAPGMAGGSKEIQVTELANDFFVEFQGYHQTGGGGGVPITSGGDSTYTPGETLIAAQTSVTISSTADGVGGNTIQNGDVLDMNFYTDDPIAHPATADQTYASEIFLKFDGIGASDDLVVILKLYDPDTHATTTRAIVVDSGDIYRNTDTIPSGYGVTLDNNDGLVIIQANDYNVNAGDNWVITGAQVLSSTDGISGSGIDLNRAVGPSGGSSGTESFATSSNDTDVLKITDIGFVATTTTTEALHLQLDVTVTDHDGDTVSETVYVNPVAPPVALDLDGDGLAFVDQSAGVHFDYFGNGESQSTAWVGPHDGLLAIDLNGDGKVNDGTEIVFAVGGSTDLEGVRLAYDTNHDGVLNAADADFAKFGVWQDANSNGVCDPGEFKSLAEAGIVSINLTTTEGSAYTAADGQVTVNGTTTFTWSNGTTGTVGDVSFAISPANDDRIVEQAQRGFATASAGYTSSLVAASLVAATATGFAHDVAPTLDDGGDVHTVSTAAVSSTPAPIEAPTHSTAPAVDHFAAPTKGAQAQSDTSHASGESHESAADHALVAAEADSHAQMSSLLDASHAAPAASNAPVFMDSVQMPVINAAAIAPAATGAANASAPGAAQVAQVAEVLADALHGGESGAVSIDHLLSSLPAADARPMLLAETGADGHADAALLTAIAHAQFATIGLEASYLVQHDSVPVNHA